ncbi:MAG: hypothetical protein NTV34_00600, partial [Proteobacteria bacterium]|nr:hypothetical protein [Pseudomonadota bacterium]
MPPPGNGGGNSAYARVASAGPTPVAESFVKNSQRISGIASAIQAFQDTATQMSMMNIYWHGVDELARRYGEVESIQKNPKATVYVAIYYKIYNYKSTKTNELYEYRGMDIGGPSLAKGFLLESGMFGYTLRIDGLADPAKTKAPAVTGPAPNWQSFYTRLTGSLYTQGGNLADAVSSLSFLNGLSIVDICLVLMQLRRADSFGFDKLQQALDWHSARMAVNVIRLRAVFDAVRIMERVGTNQALEHYLSNSAGFAKLEPDQQLQIKGCLFGRRQNQQAETKPVGKWRVKVHKWVWIYTFDDKFNVSWRDPYNGETGKGKWKITEKKLITTWLPSSTVEEWDIPLQDADQKGIARMKDGIFKLTAERLFE